MAEVTKNGSIPDIKKEAAELKSNTKKDRNTIENVLKKADDGLKARKQELYFEKLNSELEGTGKKIESYDDLTVAQRRELEAFELPENEVEKLVDSTASEIQDITTSRNDDINNFEDRIQNLYNEAQKNVEEITQKLQNPELKDDEIKALEEELNGWKNLMDDIGPEKGSESPVRKDLTAAIKNHDEGRMNGVNGMALIYPKEKVYNNDKVKKIIPENKREEFEKQVKEEKEKQDNQEKEQDNLENAGKAAGTAAAGKAVGDAVKQAVQNGTIPSESIQGDSVGKTLDDKDIKPDYLAMLGFNEDNALNYKSAVFLLENFSGDFTDLTRVEMLNDPKCKDMILKAITMIGNNRNPFKSWKFNATRDKLLKLANGPLMEKALNKIGVENIEDVNKSFNEKISELENNLKEKEEKLKDYVSSGKEMDSEEVQNLLMEKNEIEEKYNSLKGVEQFKDSTNQIKTLRTRILSFVDSLSDKSKRKQSIKALGTSASNIKENVKGKVVEAAGNVKEGVNNYFFEPEDSSREQREKENEKWMSDLVNDQNARVEAEVNRIKDDKAKDVEDKTKSQEDKSL
ncbi:MAG: hypothetical protein ACI4ON_07655 [Clostridia bacterium]